MFKSTCPTIQVELLVNGTFNVRVPGSLTTYPIRSCETVIKGAANHHTGRITWETSSRPLLADKKRTVQ